MRLSRVVAGSSGLRGGFKLQSVVVRDQDRLILTQIHIQRGHPPWCLGAGGEPYDLEQG